MSTFKLDPVAETHTELLTTVGKIMAAAVAASPAPGDPIDYLELAGDTYEQLAEHLEEEETTASKLVELCCTVAATMLLLATAIRFEPCDNEPDTVLSAP